MQGKALTELRNAHAGETIWVVASGSTMNFVDSAFFDDKIAVGINRVNQKFSCSYIVAKDARGFEEILKHRRRAKIILSRHESGDTSRPLNAINYEHWVFDHPPMLTDHHPDISAIGSDRIVVSYSTITSGIHLAAYMGASTIMICGHDCGAVDGLNSMSSYYQEIKSHQANDQKYFEWLGKIECQTIEVVDAVRRDLKVCVHSLNPFINLNLEGHNFESAVHLTGTGNLSDNALRSQLTHLESSLERRAQQLRHLESSMSFKIGRAVTFPIRCFFGKREFEH